MKPILLFFVAIVLTMSGASVAQAREPVSLDFFYDNLEPYGSWREVGDYGYCWQPRDVEQDWRPYSDGRWVYTDAGWTWDTDEPYGWAVYHYGRWAEVDQVGWIWIPGTEWGPGWVSWRHSPQYVGWAPLPPEALFLRAIGLSGWVDDYYDIGPRNYRFVENRHFGARNLRSVFIDQRQNITIIHETTNITNITYEGDYVHNGGPRFDQQSRQSDDPIRRYKLDRRQNYDGDQHRASAEGLRSRVNGDSMSVFAAPFDRKSGSVPHKLNDKLSRVEVNRGWKDAGSAAEMDETRARMKSKQRMPDDLPPRAKFDKTRQAETPRMGDRPPGPKNEESKPRVSRDDKMRRPDTSPPGKKQEPSDRPQSPSDRPSKPNMDREDKPNRQNDRPSEPMKKNDPRDEPKREPSAPMKRNDPRDEPKREPSAPMKKNDPRDEPKREPSAPMKKSEPRNEPKDEPKREKPQMERKPKSEPQRPEPAKQQEQRPAKKQQDPKPQMDRKPDAPSAKKQAPDDKPKGKRKGDDKDDKDKKN